MAQFVVRMSTEDDKTDALFGTPMDAEGLTTAIEASLESYGASVTECREAPVTGTERDAHGNAIRTL